MLNSHAPAAPAKPQARARSFLGRKRFLIGGLIVALAIGYIIYSAMQGATMYYLTVSELVSRGSAVYGEQVRLGGKVVEGTVQSDPKNMVLRFVVADDNNRLPVVYKGVVPDAFKPGAEVVLEGKLTPAGTFEATVLLAKCPTKYVPTG